MELKDVRAGLTVRLCKIPRLTVGPVPTSTAPVPCAWFGPPDVTYNSTMDRGSDELAYEITVLVSKADAKTGQTELEAYMSGHGPKSLRTALETDVSRDGLDNAMVRVDSASKSQQTVDEVGYLTAVIQVVLLVPGKPQ